MKEIGKGLKYSFTIMAHPIRGFYEMRFEKQGNIFSCLILVVLLILAFVCQSQYTGFIFNETNPKEFNVIRQICNVLIPLLLWCVANWSITVLMDGEGRFVDIFMATCYAMVPYMITVFLGVLMSRFMTRTKAHHRHCHRDWPCVYGAAAVLRDIDRSPVYCDQKRFFHHPDRCRNGLYRVSGAAVCQHLR